MDETPDEFEETGLGPMKITNRVRTLVMIREYDLEAQLAAIKGVLEHFRVRVDGSGLPAGALVRPSRACSGSAACRRI